MIKITITIDEIDSLLDSGREMFRECMEDEEGTKSDGSLFRPGVCVSCGANGKRKPRSGRSWRPGSTGCHAGRSKRRFDQYVYPGEMSCFQFCEGAEADPFDSGPDGDRAETDCYLFEEEVPGGADSLLRYILYELWGRDACADGDD